MAEASENAGLSHFLAERYVSAANPELAHLDAARASAASQEQAEQGTAVRYLGSTLIPSDETCFSLFEAQSAEDVRRLLERAALPYDRIVEALRIDTDESPKEAT
jgi:hypothetical protein